jgi:hypothetical protein
VIRAGDEIVSDVGKAVIALGPAVREAADEIERERRLPPRIVEAMKQAGVLGSHSHARGADQNWIYPSSCVCRSSLVVRRLSWMVRDYRSGGGFLSAWLPDDIGRELFGGADGIAAGSILSQWIIFRIVQRAAVLRAKLKRAMAASASMEPGPSTADLSTRRSLLSRAIRTLPAFSG